jgi:5-methylcytosine-specific restriction endonuclease McrA
MFFRHRHQSDSGRTSLAGGKMKSNPDFEAKIALHSSNQQYRILGICFDVPAVLAQLAWFREQNQAQQLALDTRYDLLGSDGNIYQVNPDSLRYDCFSKSLNCACCDRVGTAMGLCQPKHGKPSELVHFNLFAQDGALMTKDHIVPVSKGGPDHVDNLQTMCRPCNGRKGNLHVDPRALPVMHQKPKSSAG